MNFPWVLINNALCGRECGRTGLKIYLVMMMRSISGNLLFLFDSFVSWEFKLKAQFDSRNVFVLWASRTRFVKNMQHCAALERSKQQQSIYRVEQAMFGASLSRSLEAPGFEFPLAPSTDDLLRNFWSICGERIYVTARMLRAIIRRNGARK